MLNPIYVKSYAQALFDTANANHQDQEIKNYYLQIEALHRVFNDDYINLLQNYKISKITRKRLLIDILKSVNVSQEVANFMCLFVDRDLMASFHDIYKEFCSVVNVHFKIHVGTLYSTYKLDIEAMEKIQKLLSKKLNFVVHLENKIKKDIIGGVIVIIDDKIFDYSVANRLLRMKTTLLGKTNRKIIWV